MDQEKQNLQSTKQVIPPINSTNVLPDEEDELSPSKIPQKTADCCFNIFDLQATYKSYIDQTGCSLTSHLLVTIMSWCVTTMTLMLY